MKNIEMGIIKGSDEVEFMNAVKRFVNRKCVHSIIECKMQRNLFYSLSGSMGEEREAVAQGKALDQEYIAMILYRKLGGRDSKKSRRDQKKGGNASGAT